MPCSVACLTPTRSPPCMAAAVVAVPRRPGRPTGGTAGAPSLGRSVDTPVTRTIDHPADRDDRTDGTPACTRERASSVTPKEGVIAMITFPIPVLPALVGAAV